MAAVLLLPSHQLLLPGTTFFFFIQIKIFQQEVIRKRSDLRFPVQTRRSYRRPYLKFALNGEYISNKKMC